MRSLAAALELPRSTLHLYLKKLGLRASKTYLKPMLTEEGKMKRLEWALCWYGETLSRVFTPVLLLY